MAVPISNLTATWTTSANTYTGIGMNVTSTSYNANSSLLKLRRDSIDRFTVDPSGFVSLGSGTVSYPNTPITPSSSLTLKSSTSDYRIVAQDGGGRTSFYWNALRETVTGLWKYLVSNEPASRYTTSVTGSNGAASGATFAWYSAPGANTGETITWTTIATMYGGNAGYTWFSPRGTSSDFYIDYTGNVRINSANITTASITTISSNNINTTANLIIGGTNNGDCSLKYSNNNLGMRLNVTLGNNLANDYQVISGYDSSGARQWYMGYNGTFRSYGFYIATSVQKPITFWAGDTAQNMTIETSGNVLIGRTDSVIGNGVILDVAGSINASSILLTSQPVWQGYFTANVINASNYTPPGVVTFTRGITTYYTAVNTAIVIPVAGIYQVHAQQLVSTPTGWPVYLHIRKNALTQSYAYAPGAVATRDMVVSTLFDCVAGDVIDFYYGGNTSTTWATPHSSVYITKIA